PAQLWALAHFPQGAKVENSYAPSWKRLGKLKITEERLPAATGRAELFKKMLGKDSAAIQEGITRHETGDLGDTFTLEALRRRNPDFVAYSTQVFEFSGSDEAQRFYGALDAGVAGYGKVFEAASRPAAAWSYPSELDFIPARMVILERNPPPGE
ncbi:MAG TPA: hypothetical protein VIS74_02865, partial [Chthoniobacterales bacterium]